MSPMVKEFNMYVESLGSMPFDKALPLMRKEMWKIADKYGTTGDKVFTEYMNWKSKHKA